MSRIRTSVAFASCSAVAALLAAFITYFQIPAFAEGSEVCMYKTSDGTIKTAASRDRVPGRYRDSMRCMNNSQERLAAPEEVSLSGNVRSEKINSPLGEIELRWPRSAERLFGRTPLRATADAALTVSKVLSGAAFSSELQRLNLPWKVVFMDENLPEGQIPRQLISNCHPGWMTPPANIYIVAQRVAAGCGSGGSQVNTSVADSQLTEVLVHEFAHAVEFQMLQKNYKMDRMRAEGFATWFEQYAAQFSSLLSRRDLQRRNAQAAAYARSKSPESFQFSGSAEDYSRASMYFSTVEDRFGISGVVSLYERMVTGGDTLFSGIEKEFSWDRERLEKEVDKIIEKQK